MNPSLCSAFSQFPNAEVGSWGPDDRWLQKAHASEVGWPRRKQTRKMYTKPWWCTCRRKEVTDRWIPTPGILTHLEDHWGPIFFRDNPFNTHEFSKMRKSDKCRGCWNFPLLLFIWLYYLHLYHKRLEVEAIILSVGMELYSFCSVHREQQ